MKKHISFRAEFKRVLALLGPYMVLITVSIGAFLSKGSWGNFMDALLLPFWIGVVGWLLLSLYIAASYKVTGDRPGGGGGGGYGDDDNVINPTNGLPMIGGTGGVDVHGNAYGSSDD